MARSSPEKLAAALRANLRRRKQTPAAPDRPAGPESPAAGEAETRVQPVENSAGDAAGDTGGNRD